MRPYLLFAVILATGFATGEKTTLFAAETALSVPLGEEQAISVHTSLDDLKKLSLSEIKGRGRMLFEARFTSVDGVGRPTATQSDVPTKRRRGTVPGFIRTSGPDSSSCVNCHNTPTVGGAGGFAVNAFVSEGVADAEFDTLETHFSNERGTPHMFGSGFVELLAREMTSELKVSRNQARREAARSGKTVQLELTSKGVSFGQITIDPDGQADMSGVEGIDHDLIVRPFSQKGVVTSLRQFTAIALNTHHGMQVSERFGPLITWERDFDGDGVENEITPGDLTSLVVFQALLPPPVQVSHARKDDAAPVRQGRTTFTESGCQSCHRLHLPLQDATFSEPNPWNPAGVLRVGEHDPVVRFKLDTSGLDKDKQGRWRIPVFTDMKRHVIVDGQHSHLANETLSQFFVARDAFLTPRLWGVGSTGPYGHRGDLTTLREVILQHGGEAGDSRQAFEDLTPQAQKSLIGFLQSLQIRGAL